MAAIPGCYITAVDKDRNLRPGTASICNRGPGRLKSVMIDSPGYSGTGSVSDDQAHALFGQTMGYVAAAAGLFALGSYLGRDLPHGWGFAGFIAAFACLVSMNFTVQASFDEIARELHTTAGGQLRDREERWRFERRQGLIADELIAVAAGIRYAHPGDTVAIVVGSSSHARHRVVGSVAVILARRAPVPPVVVP